MREGRKSGHSPAAVRRDEFPQKATGQKPGRRGKVEGSPKSEHLAV